MPEIPLTFEVTASAATGPAIFAAIESVFGTGPGNFDYIGAFPSGGVQGFRIRCNTASDSFDIVFNEEAGDVFCTVDADMAIGNILAPDGTDMSPTARFIDSADLANLSVNVKIAVYSDAVAILVKSSDDTYWERMYHGGRGIDIGLKISDGTTTDDDGLVNIAGRPYDAAQNIADAIFSSSSSNANNQTYVHIAAGLWGRPGIVYQPQAFTEENTARRFSLFPVGAASDGGYFQNACVIGHLRYMFIDTRSALSITSMSPSASTDQSLLRLDYGTGTTRLVIVWNKTATI